MKMLTKVHLLTALKEAHDKSVAKGGPAIPYSHKTLIKLEKEGIVPVSGIEYDNRPGTTRFYTEDEVREIVKNVIKYVKGK